MNECLSLEKVAGRATVLRLLGENLAQNRKIVASMSLRIGRFGSEQLNA